MDLLRVFVHVFQNMGFRYVRFRLWHEFLRITGLIKTQYPTKVSDQKWLTLNEWKTLGVGFFFESRESLSFPKSAETAHQLSQDVARIKEGYIPFFSADWLKVTDWHTNTDTGYRYNPLQHWTEIPDQSPVAGDIKYVWEKSRFAYLYTLIRYDYHASKDQSGYVFSEIESWIEANPINCGPNWWCSQEMSLRILNWTFALNYYKNSPELTAVRFEKIIHSIYWQLKHIEANINFSRITVRNNHAISETLCLYLGGLLFPFFKESTTWKQKGKSWFEEEIAYQIYEDGTFLQFSMNYHRVVVQLLTWGIILAEKNKERFSDVVYERANKSLQFLQTCQDQITGWLPNYGNNDGALFFKLNNAHFRDYSPQLAALGAALGQTERNVEDVGWYGVDEEWRINQPKSNLQNPKPQTALSAFENAGYYVLRESNSITFVRCGAYKDRPFQADNLHLDIWVNGENLLLDAGTYKYNTDEQWIRYFAGSASHNTVMLGGFDQMRKGPRFVWYDWVREIRHLNQANNILNDDFTLVVDAKIKAFAQAGKNIWHRRRVTKQKDALQWVIEDWLENAPKDLPMHQIWHLSQYGVENYAFRVVDEDGQEVVATQTEGWYAGLYGHKEPTPRVVYSTSGRYLKTVFCLKEIIISLS